MSHAENPELFLKPGALVHMTEYGVEKKMGPDEVEAYKVLDFYRDRLSNGKLAVVIPHLVEYDEERQVGILTNIGDFRHYSCTEYFGRSDRYTPEYYSTVHGVAQVLRRVIPSSDVPNKRDYEEAKPGEVPSLAYLLSGLSGNEPEEVDELLEAVASVNSATQDDIALMPRYASHLDPNPNNFHTTQSGDQTVVAVVDWETFGLSRVGYDEGRLMSYLALDPDKQEDYSSYMHSVLRGNELTYFWRVAVNRAVREYISFSNGHYDSRLIAGGENVGDARHAIMHSLIQTVRRGISELQRPGN